MSIQSASGSWAAVLAVIWAAKMAYVEAERLRASVVWGGGVHYFFQEDWLRESTNADSYLMDHDIARCRLFGVSNLDELVKPWAALSLKRTGLARETLLSHAYRQRQERSANTDCRSVHSIGIRRAKIGARFPRRSHGTDPADFSDDCDVAKARIDMSRLSA